MSQTKFKAWFLNQGSKSECPNWRKKIWTILESCNIIFGNNICQKNFDFGLFMQFMGILKQKLAISHRKSVIRKNFTVQKILRKSFHSILGGQKNFWNFLFFLFFVTPFTFWFFLATSKPIVIYFLGYKSIWPQTWPLGSFSRGWP